MRTLEPSKGASGSSGGSETLIQVLKLLINEGEVTEDTKITGKGRDKRWKNPIKRVLKEFLRESGRSSKSIKIQCFQVQSKSAGELV